MKTIKSKSGRLYSVGSLLLNRTAKPKGGWSIHYVIKGQAGTIKKSSYVSSVNEYIRLKNLAGEGMTEEQAWIEANTQWMQRTPESKHLVDMERVMDLLEEKEEPIIAPSNNKRDYTPTDFGSKAWDAMTYSLAQDDYSYQNFLSLCEDHVLRWLDHSRNPSIGCGDCRDHFTLYINKLKRRYHSRIEARDWLYDLNSDVRKRIKLEPHDKEEFQKRALWV